ncbi:class I SAM-dependent methyltransferase [soil metagenome]|jgi:SAM-dependent methyltransferase
MTRWSEIAGEQSPDAYNERFRSLAATGADARGEAGLVTRLLSAGATVLDAGCGTGRVAIELHRRGFDCTGVDADASMLAGARAAAPALRWLHVDLVDLDLTTTYDCVLAAGNVLPLLSPGTEPEVVRRLATHLAPEALLICGFGLDPGHLPLDEAPFGLASYDHWCRAAGLTLATRLATWDGDPYDDGGYAVSIHCRADGHTQQARSSRTDCAGRRIEA